jgi:hypothetical protein
MSSDTPIFDQLVDEFNTSQKFVFGFVYPDEVPAEPEANDVTADTLYDSSHLAVVIPAIPEYDKSKPDVDATVVMEKIGHNLQTVEEMRNGAGVNTTVMERLKEADKDLGLDDFDEAFSVAAKTLERPAVVEHVQPIVKNNVTPIKRGSRLPKRRNKRGPDANLGVVDEKFDYFPTDTVTSPESAA